MNKLEVFVLKFTGLIITVIGFSGALFTFYFDEIAGRVGREVVYGPLQISGIVVFLATMFFGVFVTKFLGQIREMIEKYLNN